MSEPLPAGWVWSNLEEACASAGGGTPSKAEPAFWTNGTIPWVSPKDMKARVIVSSEDRVTESALDRLTLIPTGSLLLVVRSGILSRILPVAVTALPVTVNQDMRAFIPRDGMSSDFLAWQLIGKERDVLAATSKDGTTVASIEAPALASFPLAIAPAAEQTRIVQKLEELLSDLDAGVAELKAAQKKLQQYRQSLLKAAVEGSLTAAWREAHLAPEETGADLLARILCERRARWEAQQLAKFEAQGKAPTKGWQGKYSEPEQPDVDHLPVLPESWTWATLDALVVDGPQNGLYLPKERYAAGVPILRIDDYQIGWHRPRNELRQVTADATELETYGLAANDVVINRVNSMTHLGKSMRVPQVLAGAVFESNMMRLSLPTSVDGEFVSLYLGSDIGRARLTADAKWAVNQASINQQDVRRTPVPIPPRSEQQTVSSLVSQQLLAVDDLVSALEAGLAQSTAQRQNLLRAAFAGQLVPQDPADEPAAELLARIRAERAAHGAAKKPRAKPARGANRRNSVETIAAGAVE